MGWHAVEINQLIESKSTGVLQSILIRQMSIKLHLSILQGEIIRWVK